MNGPPVHARDRYTVTVGERQLGVRSVSGLTSSPTPDGQPAVVTLVRAVGADRTLFDWWRSSRGRPGPDVVVTLLDPASRPVAAWRLTRAVPVRWDGPDLDALVAAPALEALHVAYESLEWLDVG